jgi:hypothetical protein
MTPINWEASTIAHTTGIYFFIRDLGLIILNLKFPRLTRSVNFYFLNCLVTNLFFDFLECNSIVKVG